MERVLRRDERAYKNMEAAAKLMEATSPNNAKYSVQDVYFDAGLDWMWTTIVRTGYRECQVLNPREWKNLAEAMNRCEIMVAVDEIVNGEYFGDK